MKNNKLICAVIALLVCLTLAVSVSAAENDLAYGLSLAYNASESEALIGMAAVKTGDTFTVDVKVDKNAGFRYMEAVINFDQGKLELVESKNADNVSVAKVGNSYKIMIGDVSAAMGGNAPLIENQFVATTLTFKVIGEVDTKEALSLTVEPVDIFIDFNHVGAAKDIETKGMDLNIVGKNHDHSKYETVKNEATAKAPTCTKVGKEADEHCSYCGEMVKPGAELAKLAHNMVEVAAKNPTCEEDGTKGYFCCAACDLVSKDREGKNLTTVEAETLAKLGHDLFCYESVPATCKDGYNLMFCKRCDYTRQDVVPATGEHDVAVLPAVAATCTTDGKTEGQYCSACGTTLVEQKVIKAEGHKWEFTGMVMSKPTCTEAGVGLQKCTACEATNYGAIDALGHNSDKVLAAVAPTCGKPGLTEGKACSLCGEVQEAQKEIPATGEHTWAVGETIKEPTCFAYGERKMVCACGETKVDDKVAMIGHTMGDWEVKTEATTEAAGVQVKKCKVEGCTYEETKTIPQLEAEEDNTVLIVVIIVVVVLAAAGTATFFILRKKKSNTAKTEEK